MAQKLTHILTISIEIATFKSASTAANCVISSYVWSDPDHFVSMSTFACNLFTGLRRTEDVKLTKVVFLCK